MIRSEVSIRESVHAHAPRRSPTAYVRTVSAASTPSSLAALFVTMKQGSACHATSRSVTQRCVASVHPARRGQGPRFEQRQRLALRTVFEPAIRLQRQRNLEPTEAAMRR
jgi:hypothetical protein